MTARAAPAGALVNFTGNFLLDVANSHSLDPLLAYHGMTAATTAVPAPAPAPTSTPAPPASQPTNTTTTTSVTHTTITTTATSDGTVRQRSLSNSDVQSALRTEALLKAAPPAPPASVPSEPLESVTEAADGDESSRRNSVADGEAAGDAAGESAGDAAASAPPASAAPVVVPALIIQHSVRRLTTFLHALIPRYGPHGELVRYDPAVTNSKLAVHEDFKLDGQYHTVNTARGPVQARAYHAPHGQSLVVDQRCKSKYDLERTERFLENGGQRLVVEIRILSCAPEVQAQAAGSGGRNKSGGKGAAAAPMVVKELLFIRRVFNRIVDANPNANASGTATNTATASSPSTGLSERIVEEDSTDSTEAAAAAATESSASTASVESALQRAAVTTQAASLMRMQLTPAALAVLPQGLTKVALAGGSSSSVGLTTADDAATVSSSLSRLLYPRFFLLKRYQLTDMLMERGARPDAPLPALTPAMTLSVAKEQAAFASARSRMLIVDLLLMAVLLCFLLVHFRVIDEVPTIDVHIPAEVRSQVAAARDMLTHHDVVGSSVPPTVGLVDWVREQIFPTVVASSSAATPATAIVVVDVPPSQP